MSRLWILSLLLWTVWIGPARAESSPAEDRAYEAASKSFSDEFWERAEREWRDFTIRFPLSDRVPEAVLFEAQSLIELERYPAAIQLLQDNLATSAGLRDEYLFWTGEAHFRARQDVAAAEAFAQVVCEFPQSKRAVESALGQAAARARLQQWQAVITALEDPAGVLKIMPPSVEDHLLRARAALLLAEAYLALGNAEAASGTLHGAALENLTAPLVWEKERLLAEASFASNRIPEALAASSNLVSSAAAAGWPARQANAVLFQGRVLEALHEVDAAVAAYRQNLTTNSPAVTQQRTLLRLSRLLIEQDRLDLARSSIEQFIGVTTDSATLDLARLTLAELKLRQHMKAGVAGQTNLLQQAVANLDEVIRSAPGRTVRGRAFLYRGWAEWLRGGFAESAAAFEQAAELLPPSDDRVVARFKLADAQFRTESYETARENYSRVVQMASDIQGQALALVEPALYQSLRASLTMKRPDLATEDLERLLKAFPHGFYASTSVLLTGQELNEAGDPGAARELFEEFLVQAPESPRADEIRLAIARTHEAEGDWSRAIDVYGAMLSMEIAATNAARAEYFRALDTAQLGEEARALPLFTNLVVVHATNRLAPRAQWWIGDYYWRQGDYANAELNYQLLFQQWPNAEDQLAYQARMMAGRAAMARANPEDAIRYFTNLTSDLSCPPDLWPKAMFAYGDALVRLGTTSTNDPQEVFLTAVRVLSSIERNSPSNALVAPALGRLGDCYLQLSKTDARAYQSASNAYQRVVTSAVADLSTRSQAECGLGVVLEKLALQAAEAAQKKSLLQSAMDHYLNVFYETNVREGEEPDPFWIKRAGLEAGRIAESLERWTQARKIYERMVRLLPVLQPVLENKILKTYQATESRPE